VTETLVEFEVGVETASTWPPVPEVGRIYDCAVNGVGLIMYDGKGEYSDLRYERAAINIDADRMVTGETPFSQSIERYHFTGWDDFSGGSAQLHVDRESSAPNRYYRSEGVNPFTVPGEATLLPKVAISNGVNYTGQCIVQANNRLFHRYGDTNVRVYTTPASHTSQAVTGIVPGRHCMASDGVNAYALTTSGIVRSSGGAFAAWSDELGDGISWAEGRIWLTRRVDGSASANELWSLKPDGTLESGGPEEDEDGEPINPIAWALLEPGWHILPPVAGGGFVWFSAHGPSNSQVWRIKSGTLDPPQIAWELPDDELATDLLHYQGNVFVRAAVTGPLGLGREGPATLAGGFPPALPDDPCVRTPTDPVAGRIYRCVVDGGGALVPYLVVELPDENLTVDPEPVNNGVGGFTAYGRYVFFGWSGMATTSGNAGLGIIDLSTGGFCRGYALDGIASPGPVTVAVEWAKHMWFVTNTHGLASTTEERVASGYLLTSITDKASAKRKWIDDIHIEFAPLYEGQSVEIRPTLDWGESILDGIETSEVGRTDLSLEWQRSCVSVGVRVDLRRGDDPLIGPRLRIVEIQMHMTGVSDTQMQIPINCADEVQGRNGADLPDNGNGAGARRARFLESLIQSDVMFQDLDWIHGFGPDRYQVTGVSTRTVRETEPQVGGNRLTSVTMLILRRAGKLS
jgi:hypothetical protein